MVAGYFLKNYLIRIFGYATIVANMETWKFLENNPYTNEIFDFTVDTTNNMLRVEPTDYAMYDIALAETYLKSGVSLSNQLIQVNETHWSLLNDSHNIPSRWILMLNDYFNYHNLNTEIAIDEELDYVTGKDCGNYPTDKSYKRCNYYDYVGLSKNVNHDRVGVQKLIKDMNEQFSLDFVDSLKDDKDYDLEFRTSSQQRNHRAKLIITKGPYCSDELYNSNRTVKTHRIRSGYNFDYGKTFVEKYYDLWSYFWDEQYYDRTFWGAFDGIVSCSAREFMDNTIISANNGGIYMPAFKYEGGLKFPLSKQLLALDLIDIYISKYFYELALIRHSLNNNYHNDYSLGRLLPIEDLVILKENVIRVGGRATLQIVPKDGLTYFEVIQKLEKHQDL